MASFNGTTQTIILLLATLLMGLLAGIFFTWTNVVTTGIGKLNAIHYLKAFQEMNRTILNPLFFIVFFGPMFLSLGAIYIYRAHSIILWILLGGTIIYFIGVIMVTIFGNIPLNEILDSTSLTDISLDEAQNLRDKFETKWNTLNLIRTVSSFLSFLVLILACILKENNI